MAYESYFADPGEYRAEHLLDDWRWLVGNTPLRLFRATAMGDLFLMDEREQIHFLDMVDGKFTPFARDEVEFLSKLEDTGVRRLVLSSTTVRALRSEGRTLASGECFSPEIPLVLGGDLDKVAACSLAIHSSIMGQVHRQRRDVPPGEPLLVKVEGAITGQMLDIYARFGGEIDGFVRVGSPEERAVMNNELWYRISALLQEIALLKTGQTTPEYSAQIKSKLSSEAGDALVAERLWDMA